MAQTVDILNVEQRPEGGTQITFMPPDMPNATNPATHYIPEAAYAFRAVEFGYDPAAPDFRETVTRHILHESHTPAPAAVRADARYRPGVVHDLAAADAVIEWRFKPQHVAAMRARRIRPDEMARARRSVEGPSGRRG